MGALNLCIQAATNVVNPNQAGQPLKASDIIAVGTQRILGLPQSEGARRFQSGSSGAVYGPHPIDLERIPDSFAGAPNPHVRPIPPAVPNGPQNGWPVFILRLQHNLHVGHPNRVVGRGQFRTNDRAHFFSSRPKPTTE